MQQRMTLLLAATALVVAVLGATPLGRAAGDAVLKIPPLAQRANYAKVAGTAENAKALGGHKASAFALLDGSGKLPASVVSGGGSAGAAGPQGPKGDPGSKGDPGAKGDRGPAGLVAAYSNAAGTAGTFTALAASDNLVDLKLPAGRYLLLATVTIAPDLSSASYFAGCRLTAGTAKQTAVTAGAKGNGTATFSILTTSLLYESSGTEQVVLNCNDTPASPSRWADAHITALQVASSSIRISPGGVLVPTG
jgi:hypothetical protein